MRRSGLARREKQPLLDTLKTLVEIESGSADVEGVTRIGALIPERLRGLGGGVDGAAKCDIRRQQNNGRPITDRQAGASRQQ